jgi:hypothetical protein
MEREEGFYWVIYSGIRPEIAEWTLGSWLLCGAEEVIGDAVVEVLGERLIPPPWNTQRPATSALPVQQTI